MVVIIMLTPVEILEGSSTEALPTNQTLERMGAF